MKRILLTGATGAIGRAIVGELAEKQYPTLLLLRDPSALTIRGKNIESEAFDLENITQEVSRKISAYKPEIVIHAGWMGVENDKRNFAPFVAGNLKSCLQLFEASEATCRQWIGFGSQAEYSARISEPITENTPTFPLENYGIAKLAACHMLKELCAPRNISFSWLRLFPCYSKDLRSTYIIPYLIESMRNGQLPEIRTPRAAWGYLHTQDAAKAIMRVIEKPQAPGIYNLGHEKSVTVEEIVLTLAELLKYSRMDELKAHLKANTTPATRRLCDVSRFSSTFDWQPQTGLREGLSLCI